MAASTSSAYVKARELIDEAHMRDPLYLRRKDAQAARAAAAVAAMPSKAITAGTAADDVGQEADEEGQDEMTYADAMEQWVDTLLAKAGAEASDRLKDLPGDGLDLVRLAARCQHLERFATPRNTFPDGKAGYLQWRRTLYTKQANRATELLTQAGVAQEESAYVHKWVSKTDLKPGRQGGEWGTQVSIVKL